MELKRVVVTGLGALTPLGNTVDEYWKGLIGGVSGSNLITRFDASKHKTKFACEVKGFNLKTKFACEVKGFNPDEYFDRKEARRIDRYALYALYSADQAIKDAGIDPGNIDRNYAGVIFGSGIGGIDTFLEEIKGFANGDGTPRFSPFFVPKMISDIAAGHISMKYGFHGPNFGIVSACATSTHTLIDAFNYIRLSKANLIIAGGSEASINAAGVGGFNSMQAISTRNDEYKTASVTGLSWEKEPEPLYSRNSDTRRKEVQKSMLKWWAEVCRPMHTISRHHTLRDWEHTS